MLCFMKYLNCLKPQILFEGSRNNVRDFTPIFMKIKVFKRRNSIQKRSVHVLSDKKVKA